MLSLTLALAAATPSVIDAERAFAKLAQHKGQWTAFRATAAPGAILFWPKPTAVEIALKDLKDPPKSVDWWPVKAWLSCDGTLGVTSGGALWPDGRHGWFTTVWRKQSDGGWKWVLDHGGFIDVARPKPAVPKVEVASCAYPYGRPPPPLTHSYSPDQITEYIGSDDGTLSVIWGWLAGIREVGVRINGTPGEVLREPQTGM